MADQTLSLLTSGDMTSAQIVSLRLRDGESACTLILYPADRELGNLKTNYPGTPMMALTATANHQVRDDIIRSLKITGCLTVTSSFNRANLIYEIRPKPGPKKVIDEIVRFIASDYRGQCGIIYASSRDNCEKIARDIREADPGISAAHYHAGMTKDDRSYIQRSWQEGKVKIIVATVSP